MQGAREAFLADAGFAEQQHADLGAGGPVDEVVGAVEALRIADHLRGARQLHHVGPQVIDLMAQLEQVVDDRV